MYISFRRILKTISGSMFLLWMFSQNAFSSVFSQHVTPPDAARGTKLWVSSCGKCHNHRSPNEFRPDQWKVIMVNMRLQAGLTRQDAADILAFLSGDTTKNDDTFQQHTKPAHSHKKYAKNDDVSIHHPPKKDGPETRKKKLVVKRSGALVYKHSCVECHGDDGKGVIPGAPDLTLKNGVLAQSDKVLFQRIKNGYLAMPPKGGNPNLTDQDIRSVLNYIKSFRAK